MGSRQEDVALAFIGFFRDTWPEDLDAPLRLVTEDCYYQGIVPTTEPIRGKAAIKAKWQGIKAAYGDQRHDMRGVASNETLVFTERTDYSFTGGKWVSIPLVAVFEINGDNKIFAWREYLDAGSVARQIGMDAEALVTSLNPDSA